MAIKKSKVKSKPTLKSSKTKAKPKPVTKIKKKALKSKPIRKPILKAKPKTKPVAKKRILKMNKTIATKPVMKSLEKLPTQTMEVTRQMMAPQPTKRAMTPMVKRTARAQAILRTGSQFAFMKAPLVEHAFEVGDNVEVFCDHEKSRERIRGWVRGIVVQVDNKMVAVQFRSNVFLTDGWMVPDRILWYPLSSEHIRPVPGKKPVVKKEFIPDY